MPRVSVILPVRNQAAFLGASLDSVFRQPYDDCEVIVVDDGSTEDLAPAVAPWRDRIRLVRQPPRGVAAATNHGARLATGEILAFHDADDLMEVTRLTALLPHLDADPALAMVFGNGIEIRADGTPVGPIIADRQAHALIRRGVRVEDLLRRSLVYLQATLIRRRVFEARGGLPAFVAGGDWGLALRCVLHEHVRYVHVPCFRYRRHDDSLTAARVPMAAAAVAVLRDLIAREPSLAARVGTRRVHAALARRLARLAAQQTRAGDPIAARRSLAEAATLAPWTLKYRLRLLRLGRAMPARS
jgi:glycosyltransferase involved in cell wall biosynthesis